MLKALRRGYKVRNPETEVHLVFFVNDLKLLAGGGEDLEVRLREKKKLSKDICMEFGLEKCAKEVFTDGIYSFSENIEIKPDLEIKQL